MRILVVEDEENLNAVIKKRLILEGYSVDSCFDGMEALDYIISAEYDLIILDIMLPKLDGISVLKRIRSSHNTPVILLTAMDKVSDKVNGLDAGADDYLIKPFDFTELFARMRAVLRKNAPIKSNIIQVADLKIDCSQHTAYRAGKQLDLSQREFSIIEYMARNAGQALTRAQISEHTWNFDYEGGSNIIDVYIRYLRKKIDDGYDKKLIQTIRGIGYSLRDADEK